MLPGHGRLAADPHGLIAVVGLVNAAADGVVVVVCLIVDIVPVSPNPHLDVLEPPCVGALDDLHGLDVVDVVAEVDVEIGVLDPGDGEVGGGVVVPGDIAGIGAGF